LNIYIIGTVYSGTGLSAVNKLLACFHIPSINQDLYKRYERLVGKYIEQEAKDSCKRAAEEERRLVTENIDQLCQNLYV